MVGAGNPPEGGVAVAVGSCGALVGVGVDPPCDAPAVYRGNALKANSSAARAIQIPARDFMMWCPFRLAAIEWMP